MKKEIEKGKAAQIIVKEKKIAVKHNGKVERNSQNNLKQNKELDMEENSLDLFKNHMEFLGYEFKPSDDDPNTIYGSHSNYGPVIVTLVGNRLFLKSFFRCNENAKNNLEGYLSLVNELNKKSDVATYIGYEDSLFMVSIYTGAYDKTYFAEFVDLWNGDSNRKVFEFEELKNFIQ